MQVRKEMQAQIEKFKELTGNFPPYVDGHQHVHILPGRWISHIIFFLFEILTGKAFGRCSELAWWGPFLWTIFNIQSCKVSQRFHPVNTPHCLTLILACLLGIVLCKSDNKLCHLSSHAYREGSQLPIIFVFFYCFDYWCLYFWFVGVYPYELRKGIPSRLLLPSDMYLELPRQQTGKWTAAHPFEAVFLSAYMPCSILQNLALQRFHSISKEAQSSF